MPELYIPGWIQGADTAAIEAICKAHDSDLTFRKNASNGQYTIFQRLQRDNAYAKADDAMDDTVIKSDTGSWYPVRGWGYTLPSQDEVRKWLYEADAYRHDLLVKVRKHNQGVKAEQQRQLQESGEEGSRRLEFAMRREGHDVGTYRSFRPDGKRRRAF